MPFVNEKLLRLVLGLVGVAALAVFAWKIFDFIRNQDTLLDRLDAADRRAIAAKFEAQTGQSSGSHLQVYEAYQVVQDLNITGWEEPPPPPPEPDEPVYSVLRPSEVSVPFIQHPTFAYIQPAGASGSADGVEVPGDLYALGQEFELESKPGLKLKLHKIDADGIVLVVNDTDEVRVNTVNMEVDAAGIFAGDVPLTTEQEAFVYVPERTELNQTTGVYEVGTKDVAELEGMTEEELLSSVTLRPSRDQLSGQPDGVIVARVNHPIFDRLGLQKEDVVTAINGQQVLNRDEIAEMVRNLSGPTLEITIRRLGGERTLSYRLPQ